MFSVQFLIYDNYNLNLKKNIFKLINKIYKINHISLYFFIYFNLKCHTYKIYKITYVIIIHLIKYKNCIPILRKRNGYDYL